VEARSLEALVEARLALRFIEEVLKRSAAGDAFWKVRLVALLRLELDKLKSLAKTEEGRRWLESTAVPRVPTTKIKALASLLEDVGHYGVSAWTNKSLDIHDYHITAQTQTWRRGSRPPRTWWSFCRSS